MNHHSSDVDEEYSGRNRMRNFFRRLFFLDRRANSSSNGDERRERFRGNVQRMRRNVISILRRMFFIREDNDGD